MHRWALALWLPVGRAGRGEESRVPAASSSSPQGHVERPRPVSSAWPCTQTPRLADSSLLLPSGPGAALAALCALATPAHAWAHSPCIKLSSAVNTSVPVAARTPPPPPSRPDAHPLQRSCRPRRPTGQAGPLEALCEWPSGTGCQEGQLEGRGQGWGPGEEAPEPGGNSEPRGPEVWLPEERTRARGDTAPGEQSSVGPLGLGASLPVSTDVLEAGEEGSGRGQGLAGLPEGLGRSQEACSLSPGRRRRGEARPPPSRPAWTPGLTPPWAWGDHIWAPRRVLRREQTEGTGVISVQTEVPRPSAESSPDTPGLQNHRGLSKRHAGLRGGGTISSAGPP